MNTKSYCRCWFPTSLSVALFLMVGCGASKHRLEMGYWQSGRLEMQKAGHNDLAFLERQDRLSQRIPSTQERAAFLASHFEGLGLQPAGKGGTFFLAPTQNPSGQAARWTVAAKREELKMAPWVVLQARYDADLFELGLLMVLARSLLVADQRGFNLLFVADAQGAEQAAQIEPLNLERFGLTRRSGVRGRLVIRAAKQAAVGAGAGGVELSPQALPDSGAYLAVDYAPTADGRRFDPQWGDQVIEACDRLLSKALGGPP